VKVSLSFALAILFAASVVAQGNDWLIVPGKRIGPITPDTSRADLDRLFGKVNVLDRLIDAGEGDMEPATVVFPHQTDALLAIFWERRWRENGRLPYENHKRVEYLVICEVDYLDRPPPCKWHTEEGVSLGTTLQGLEALNGRGFQMTAWGSDIGGNIVSWRGGMLAGYRDGLGLGLHLDFPTAPKGATREGISLFDSIKQEKGMMMSSDPSVRALRPIVTHMQLRFPRAN
jgi:hypothetical protein